VAVNPSGPADLLGLVGHRFPGGTRTVEHWENWLLTDCTQRAPMTDGLLHPVVLFHVPIQGVGTSIGELFELCGADGSPGSVTLLGYDWEYLAPLYEDVEYGADGGIVHVERDVDRDVDRDVERDVERHGGADGRTAHDDITFSIELADPEGRLVARVTNRWRFGRGARAPHGSGPVPDAGRPLRPLRPVITNVGADRMKTMAALLRDPYAIHWDPDAVAAAGLGDRPVNQGPLNLGYVANMLMANFGDGSIRRLSVAFHGRAFAGDTVVAGGTIDRETVLGGDPSQQCTVWLDREGVRLVSGTAVIAR
jgi:acyl dehydratase